MKVLIVAEFTEGALGVSYSNAFKKNGCEVYNFDLINEFNKVNPFSANRYLNSLFGYLFYPAVNKRLLDEVKLNKPDLVFIIKGAFVFPGTLIDIKNKTNSLLFCFNPDNPFNFNKGASNKNIRESIPYYDCYFIWGKFLIPELIKVGAKRVQYLPFAYDPELHYPVKVGEEEKKMFGSDIAFIGSYDKEREKFLMSLVDYDLAIWGNGWDKLSLFSPLKKKWKDRDVIGEDFSKVCNSSKIVLNHIRKQNNSAHNMKTFEIPACKGFMLTMRTKEQCEFFEEGKDIACFETPEELRSKIKQFLNDLEARNNMRENVYKKVQKHSYNVRVEDILNISGKCHSEEPIRSAQGKLQ